ncbi:MAG: FkbM family methyltransferase [Ignavibacteriaceae bacterium]
MDKKLITYYLAKAGLYKPLRKIYNFIGRFNKQTELVYNNSTIRFRTPTFFLDDYVKDFAGEKHLLDEFLSRLNPDDVFWDIGANIGLYSLVISKNVILQNKIYAFEPEEDTFNLLQSNIKLNDARNVYAHQLALGNEVGEKIFYSSDTPNFGAHSFVQRTDFKVKKHGKKVKIYTGDKLIEEKKAETPSAVKIDVEGAEILVLKGMTALLQNSKLRIILCEVHDNLLPLFGSSGEAVVNIIKTAGFKVNLGNSRKTQHQYIFTR